MIGYVTVGTNDMPRAAAFYDALLATLGAKRFMEADRFIAWAVSPTQPSPTRAQLETVQTPSKQRFEQHW